MDIFKGDEDYRNFLKRLFIALGSELEKVTESVKIPVPGEKNTFILQKNSLRIKPLPRDSFDLVCYCLMPNHFHLLLRQNGDIPVGDLLLKVCTSYSMYFNKKYARVGPLFQDVFKSINISDNSYILWLSAYIHQNPAVAGLVWDLSEWKWSSYPGYIKEVKGDICNKAIILEQFKAKVGYQQFVGETFDEIKRKKELTEVFLDK